MSVRATGVDAGSLHNAQSTCTATLVQVQMPAQAKHTGCAFRTNPLGPVDIRGQHSVPDAIPH